MNLNHIYTIHIRERDIPHKEIYTLTDLINSPELFWDESNIYILKRVDTSLCAESDICTGGGNDDGGNWENRFFFVYIYSGGKGKALENNFIQTLSSLFICSITYVIRAREIWVLCRLFTQICIFQWTQTTI